MIKKIFKLLLVLLLILFPFIGGALLGKYTPYTEGNSMTTFVILYVLFVLVAVAALLYTIYKFKQSFVQPVLPGILLFFFGCVMLGIAGLAVAPDLSIKMLEHPEREHCRYIILFVGVFFFGIFFINIFINNILQLKTIPKWIMIALFVIALGELIWEFSHHYLYPEGLKEWVSKGNKAEDFNSNYDDWKSITTGAIGRFFIYVLMLWLSIRLYIVQRVTIWNPILTSVMCVLGIFSAISFFIYAVYTVEIPKEFGFLMLFFIPGIPFLIMYWIGVALLTKNTTNKTSLV